MVYLLGDPEVQGVPLCLLDQSNPSREEKEKGERRLSVGFHGMVSALPLTLTGEELVTASKRVIIGSEGKQQFMILNVSKTYRWIWAYKQEDTGDVTHTIYRRTQQEPHGELSSLHGTHREEASET